MQSSCLFGRPWASLVSCQGKDEELGPWRPTAGFELVID